MGGAAQGRGMSVGEFVRACVEGGEGGVVVRCLYRVQHMHSHERIETFVLRCCMPAKGLEEWPQAAVPHTIDTTQQYATNR